MRVDRVALKTHTTKKYENMRVDRGALIEMKVERGI